MLENTKRLAIIILVIILIAAGGYGYWHYTNNGSIVIDLMTPPTTSAPPIAIAIDGIDSGVCDKASCTITLVAGEHFISITQENRIPYEARIQLARGEMRRIKAALEEVGQFSEGDTSATNGGTTATTKKIPPHPAHDIPFVIRTDEKRGLTSLVKKDNDAVIAYFPRPFINPRLVANDTNTIAWIIDGRPEQNGIYEVNIAAASRTSRFITIEQIDGMLPSPSGTKLLITTKTKSYIIDKAAGDMPVPLKASINPQLAAWRTDTTLFAITGDEKQTQLLQFAVAGTPQEKVLKTWDAPHNVIDLFWDAKTQKLWIQSKAGVATVAY